MRECFQTVYDPLSLSTLLQRTGSGLEARLVRMKDAVVRLQLIKDEQLLNTTLENTKRFLTQLSPVSTKEMLGYT